MVDAVKDSQAQGAPPVAGQSHEKKEVTPRTFTEEEYRNAISNEKASAGRLKSQLEVVSKERDTYKTKVDEVTALVEETTSQIADLEEDYKLAISDNLDASEINKIKKDLRTEKAKLLAEISAKNKALDSEREQWAGMVAEAQAAHFEVDTFEIAEDYEGGDWNRLKALCEKANVKKREDIIGLADVLWTKKGKGKDADGKPFIPDSGVTNGGGVNFDSLTPAQRREEVARRLRK